MSPGRAEHRTIEVDDAPEVSQRTFVAQLVGRGVLVAVIVGVAAGLVGHGPISWARAEAADGSVVVEYERFGRRGGSQSLDLVVDRELAIDGRWTVVVSGALAEEHEVSTISPEPVSMRASPSGVEMIFEQVADADLAVVLAITPGGMWRESSRVAVPGVAAVDLDQFIYP